jgi:hypothetical protein
MAPFCAQFSTFIVSLTSAKEDAIYHGLGYVYLYRKDTLNWLVYFVQAAAMLIDLR